MHIRPSILAVLAALVILSGCTMWRERPVVNNWSDATGGEGLERSFWNDIKAKNWNELQRHIAGNFVSVTPEEGHMDRAAALQHYQQAQVDEFSLTDVQVELNSTTLVVSYSVSLRGSYSGRPLPADPVRMMSVWQQQKAGWMLIAHTVIGPEKK